MKKTLLTLCDGPYEQNRQLLNEIAISKGCNEISLKFTDLDSQFTEQVKNILTIKRGLGLCVWKPYIILNAFKNMNENDYIIYVDSADILHPQIFDYIEHKIKENNILLVPSPNRNLQKHFTKRDCFIMMNCDKQEYWDAVQIEAGLVVAKKNEITIKILEEWLHFCKNENIITDIPNICGLDNLPNFVTHRHDQSIMSNLAVKYNLLIDPTLLNFIRHNVV
jgi:hypothetical protein